MFNRYPKVLLDRVKKYGFKVEAAKPLSLDLTSISHKLLEKYFGKPELSKYMPNRQQIGRIKRAIKNFDPKEVIICDSMSGLVEEQAKGRGLRVKNEPLFLPAKCAGIPIVELDVSEIERRVIERQTMGHLFDEPFSGDFSKE